MDLSLFQQKSPFPQFVSGKLNSLTTDFNEKQELILKSRESGHKHLEAGVVLLINYRINQNYSEYVFQLIKRSNTVTQAGDISCPGGILHPAIDRIFGCLLKTGIIPSVHEYTLSLSQNKKTNSVTRLFLANALREAWEEIGLNPFNVRYLGALPCYSLSMFARTIFPLVCLTEKPFPYKLSSEVEKIIEIPLSFFFDESNYAELHLVDSLNTDTSGQHNSFPCLVITDASGNEDILWGATFNIITNFLRIISDNSLPSISTTRIVKKVLSNNYIWGAK